MFRVADGRSTIGRANQKPQKRNETLVVCMHASVVKITFKHTNTRTHTEST